MTKPPPDRSRAPPWREGARSLSTRPGPILGAALSMLDRPRRC
jgi:hypothetical protein